MNSQLVHIKSIENQSLAKENNQDNRFTSEDTSSKKQTSQLSIIINEKKIKIHTETKIKIIKKKDTNN